jgi:hypothetical protein
MPLRERPRANDMEAVIPLRERNFSDRRIRIRRAVVWEGGAARPPLSQSAAHRFTCREAAICPKLMQNVLGVPAICWRESRAPSRPAALGGQVPRPIVNA